jgi:hypothetical protein
VFVNVNLAFKTAQKLLFQGFKHIIGFLEVIGGVDGAKRGETYSFEG